MILVTRYAFYVPRKNRENSNTSVKIFANLTRNLMRDVNPL